MLVHKFLVFLIFFWSSFISASYITLLDKFSFSTFLLNFKSYTDRILDSIGAAGQTERIQPSTNLGNSGTDCIANYYEKILSDPAGHGQNWTLIKETVHADWQLQNLNGETGPSAKGLKLLMDLWSIMFLDINVERQFTLLCRYVCT